MRIKQLLVNNNFPNQIVDRTIKNFLDRKFANSNIDSLQDETNRTAKPTVTAETHDDETAKLFYENQMTSSYKQEEAALRKIIHDNVKPLEPVKTIKLQIFYKNKKLKHLFIKDRLEKRGNFCVIYQFKCDKMPSLETYNFFMGWTTTAIKEG